MSNLIYLEVRTERRNHLVDVTPQIQKVVAESGTVEGSVGLFVPHTTAAITINENADPSVKSDILSYLEKLIPQNGRFSHAEGNSDAHIKSSLVGPRLSLFISGGRLVLGTWQGIYFCEFDGPRNRKLIVKVIRD
jgi:secondary thiamine-phosphate synthase enzyme